MRRLILILATLTAAACGSKGPLTLPPKTVTKPAQAVPAPAPQDASRADDSSKPAAGMSQ